jgi:hypothetical protein
VDEHTPGQQQAAGRDLDQRQALEYMREVLDNLADGRQITQ